MARPHETLEHIAEFLIEKAMQAATTLEHVDKVRKEQGENAVQLIVSHPNYRKAINVAFSVSEICDELRLKKATVHKILTPANGDVLAEYGITMRKSGTITKWTYDGALLTSDAKVKRVAVTPYAIPEYPGDTVRPDAIPTGVASEPQVPKTNARGEDIVGTFHLSAFEVALLRYMHAVSMRDGQVSPRSFALGVLGLTHKCYAIQEVEGKESDLEELKDMIRAEVPETLYPIKSTEMYPVVEP